ncbi:hypothetical protein ABOM_003314 [Aspergillus bombycis]|uniref:Ankyrin repeat-containing protein n=1 Tax=Aspergillus bombycis TaxID=109264 RepID=A0A1F8A836_9EURO|nr:hypothetical protein ABOM_003314 [Aspergillus bombycis]OGM47867.1 hypothetical protein ABOM_003314 [Aspergillus bombycis]
MSSVVTGREQAVIEVGREILDAGGHVTCSAFPSRRRFPSLGPDEIINIDPAIYIFQELEKATACTASDFPEEAAPLVIRLTAQLRQLIHQGADMKDWMISYAHWPDGLLILLQAGYNATEDTLFAALDFNCEASVRILIETGNIHVGPNELYEAACHPNFSMVELIIQALVDRRKCLQFLAETHLSVDEVSALEIRPDTLIDFQAHLVTRMLEDKRTNLGGVGEPYAWSVYGALEDNLSIADRLWEAGFRDVEVPDVRGRTLLMTISGFPFKSLLEQTDWLIGKGAQPYRLYESTPALHFVGFAVGRSLPSLADKKWFDDLIRLPLALKQVFCQILTNGMRDACCCFVLLVDAVAAIITWLVVSFEKVQTFFNKLPEDILRFLTFNCMGLTHTCSHPSDRAKTADEISKIHHERYLLKDFEILLADVLSAYRDSTKCLPEFLTGYWVRRMKEYHSWHVTPSEEEIESLREAGVVLHGPTAPANIHSPFSRKPLLSALAHVDELILSTCGVVNGTFSPGEVPSLGYVAPVPIHGPFSSFLFGRFHGGYSLPRPLLSVENIAKHLNIRDERQSRIWQLYNIPIFRARDTPLRSLYRLFEDLCASEFIMLGYECRYFFFHSEPHWELACISDPRDEYPIRYAILASMVEVLVDAFNARLELGIRRDNTTDPSEQQGSNFAREEAPSWPSKIATLEKALVFSEPGYNVSDMTTEQHFPKRNIKVPS